MTSLYDEIMAEAQGVLGVMQKTAAQDIQEPSTPQLQQGADDIMVAASKVLAELRAVLEENGAVSQGQQPQQGSSPQSGKVVNVQVEDGTTLKIAAKLALCDPTGIKTALLLGRRS